MLSGMNKMSVMYLFKIVRRFFFRWQGKSVHMCMETVGLVMHNKVLNTPFGIGIQVVAQFYIHLAMCLRVPLYICSDFWQ